MSERHAVATTPLLGEEYRTVLAEVERLFKDDVRKGKSEPYLSHLLSVSALVLRDGGTHAEILAALLHDTMEDKGLSKADIRDVVGPVNGEAVANIVHACSDGVDEDGNSQHGDRGPENWHARKRAYLQHLANADGSVLRVSAADKLDNARDVLADLQQQGQSAMQWFNAPPADQLWWYASLDALFSSRLPDSLLTRQVHSTVTAIKALISVPEATRAWEANAKERRRLRGASVDL